MLLNWEDYYIMQINIYFWVKINGKAESESRYGIFKINVSNTKPHTYS